jgi:ADP-ribose pyrophosphatase YjhB (NUDIX family)
MTIKDDELCVLLGERTGDPFKGRLALIGGYIHVDEDKTAGKAAARVLKEKAGIAQLYIEQLSTFSGPHRDPRGWTMSVAYFSLSPEENLEPALGLVGRNHLVPVTRIPDLPFDHNQIIDAAVSRVRAKSAYTDLPARFLREEFTIRELHQAYRIAIGEDINEDAFRRKIMERDFVERTGNKKMDLGARPSQLYRLKNGQAIFDRRF